MKHNLSTELNSENNINVILLDSNAVASFKLREHFIPINHQLHNVNRNRFTTKDNVNLIIGYERRMKIDAYGNKTYRNCDNCPDTELTTPHVFACPAILADTQN